MQEDKHEYWDAEKFSLIQPLKQKQFEFTIQAYTHQSMQMTRKRKQQIVYQWKPVLNYKKLYQEPKFVMSLQRKKARIISSLRESTIVNCKQPSYMIGTKLKNKTNKNNQKLQKSTQLKTDALIQLNQQKLSKVELKIKKNPYMNFSLLYMTERKKNITGNSNTKSRAQSACHRTQSREKGSDNPYLHMIMLQRTKQKQKRPNSSYIFSSQKRIERPKSQIK